MAKNLRTFIDQLVREKPDDIKVVQREVDPILELTGVAQRLEERGQIPALYFEKVRGSSLPVMLNLCASYERLALALGTTVQSMVRDYADFEKNPIPVQEVASAPVHEIVLTGDEVDLDVLPLTKHNELDNGRFISSGVSITKDPDTGALNAGIYRHQVFSKDCLGVSLGSGHHGRYSWERYTELNRPMEIAIVIGHHPGFTMAAVSKLQKSGGELEIAGALLGEPLEVVRAKTVDLLVPAQAEIVIEGQVVPGDLREEGPFGEWPGYYTGVGPRHYLNVTAITMRRDAIYQDVFAGHPEHCILGAVPRMGSLYRVLKGTVPGVTAVNLPLSAKGRVHCYISMKKRADGEPKHAAFAAFTVEPDIKHVFVVDDDVNVYDENDVLWAVATRFDAGRDLAIIPDVLCTRLLPTNYGYEPGKHGEMATKLIFDATVPLPPYKFPPRIHIPEEVLQKIDPDTDVLPYRPRVSV